MTVTPAFDTTEDTPRRTSVGRGGGTTTERDQTRGDLLGGPASDDAGRLSRKVSNGAKSLFSVQERGASPAPSDSADVVDLTTRSSRTRAELLPASSPARGRATTGGSARDGSARDGSARDRAAGRKKGAANASSSDDDPELLATMATVSEAIEYVERARGQLYTMYHLLSRAEILFAEAVDSLDDQGRGPDAELLEAAVIGREMLEDRRGFEVVEEFDEQFYVPVSAAVRELERRTVAGRRHARDAVQRRRELEHRDAE